MKQDINVAVVQHSCIGSYEENLDKSIAGIKEAKSLGSQLVLLPELHTQPYFCVCEDPGNFELAETIPGSTTETLSRLAQDLEIIIITSIFENRSQGIYHNTAVVLDTDGKIAGQYRKMHIPEDPGYHEKYYFAPGDQGFVPIQTSIGKLGLLVCWDQWFPEAARIMALSGAEILLYPSAIGWDPRDDEQEKIRQRNAWITIQKSHAIANCLPVAASNRIGFEPDPTNNTAGSNFWGSSFIAGPQGEILAKATIDEPGIITATINTERSKDLRQIWPYFRDRRVDAYQDLI